MTLLALALRSALRRLRTRPLRTLLTLLQILLGSLAMTLALSAFLGTPQSQGALSGGERFDLVAGSRGADGSSSSYSLFGEADLAELRELAPDVRTLALYGSAFSPQVELGGRRYQFRGAALVSPEYFDLEGVTPTRGSLFSRRDRGEAAREQMLAASRRVFADEVEAQGLESGSDFYIEEPGERFGMPDGVLNPIVALFGLFGVVALFAGTIGIFSIMLVDVLERTHEIGLRRALGATGGRITAELVAEAAMLSGLGGVAGAALTAAVMPLLEAGVGDTLFFDVNLSWRPLAALIVVTLVMTLSALLSLFPARQAARLRPVEALREVS